LISILLGRHTPFVWRDTPVSEVALNRLYYGWHQGADVEHPGTQLVPITGTVEALNYGKEVAARLPALAAQYTQLRGLFDPEWVVSPLWTAPEEFMDNQLALACVVLERLASAYQYSVRPTGRFPKPTALMKPEQQAKLLKEMRAVLKEVADAETLTADAVNVVGKRIDSLFQPTNNERLLMVFEELGIPLGEAERGAVRNRNLSMHGRATLKDSKDTSQCDEELRRFDILRTLIGRAMLHLLAYAGPYVDYAARPNSGNFPICYCSPPAPVAP
jgi:hypothetical protein